jgi:hypothetical protein
MATTIDGGTSGGGLSSATERDRSFFLIMAMVIAATVVSGFTLQFIAGRSSLGAPWWVHVHGLTFMGWLLIYLTQNFLVWRGDLASHRKLGRVAAFYVGWMVLVGLSLNTLAAINHRIPPVFEPNVFLVMDWMTVIVFAGLTWAGVRNRLRTDWHRRLMLCGAIIVMTPGVGRLLPLPLLGTWIIWTIWAATRGRVHPAYAWGFGTITLAIALIRPIAFTPPLLALTAKLMG